jgi:alanyl-tRNA synthetase
MTTMRLYYDDAYTTAFTARVIERLTHAGQPAVVLDRTGFYPTGGGQPADSGSINGVPVLDVFKRADDAAVVHLLAAPLDADEAACALDWARRFDHMQHHTGQHILTQAFVQTAGAQTVGFHLSADSVTIDLDTPRLTDADAARAEDLANQIVWENRPVTARLIDPDAAEGVRVRRMPGQLHTDGLRVIEVEGFDRTACGGTHVARTGEIGSIKVLRLTRRGDKTRVEFRCGARALCDYRDKNAIVSALTAALTCGQDEITTAVERLQGELKSALSALKTAAALNLEGEAARLAAAAPERGGLRLVQAVFENRDGGDLKLLAAKLAEMPGVVALLASGGAQTQMVFARSADLPHDMRAALAAAFTALGQGRGGGQPALAQGGGPASDAAQLQAALAAAEQALLGH